MQKGVIHITLFCFLILQKGVGQNYFNKRITIDTNNNSSLNFKLYNDTFYIATQVEERYTTYHTYLASLLKVDLQGNIVRKKIVKNAGEFFTQTIAITKLNNNYYQSGNSGSNNYSIASLIKFNEIGDTILTKTYGDTIYSSIAQEIKPYYKKPNHLIMFGSTDSTCPILQNSQYRISMLVLDSNGIVKQKKISTEPCKYLNITDVITAENKGYLIAFGGTVSSFDAAVNILKVDSNLNVLWNKQINITNGAAISIVNHNNQYYTTLSANVDSVWNFSYKWGRPVLTRLDLNGTIIWQKYYGIKEYAMQPSGIKECANGDYIMCGSKQASVTANGWIALTGWLMRTDSLGNLKWWKTYIPNTTPTLDTTADNYLHDIMELPNGDIAALGYSGAGIIPGYQTWLLKVDSNGCFGTGNCPPNIATGFNTKPKALDADFFGAYPNPANTTITIELQNTTNKINTIELYNNMGQPLQTTTTQQQTTFLNISQYPPGVYYIKLNGIGKSIKKIVIQR